MFFLILTDLFIVRCFMQSLCYSDMDLKDSIYECTTVQGLSGREDSVAEYLRGRLEKSGITAYTDTAGNVRGRIESKRKDAKTILLEAHMDQIGLMVSGIDDEGYIRFVNLGGIDERILCGMEVKILGRKTIDGIVTSFSPVDKEKKKRTAETNELRIDIGLDKNEAAKFISPGNGVLMKFEFTGLMGDKLSSAAMDNRAGAAAVLDSVERLAKTELIYNIEVVFSTQEELGLHGAFAGIEPGAAEAAIAVDVTHGMTPDSKEETGVFPLGSGAVICRGPNLHYDYTRQLIKTAEEKSIPYEIEVASDGSGTTAWAIQTIGNGIPVMLISIPLRYMHTNVETLKLSDVKAVSDLIFEAVSGGVKLD